MSDTATVAQDWTDVAAAWDAHVDEVDDHSAAATAALLDRVAVQPGDRVLELAAGPGTLGATWSELVGPGGSVLLSDIAPGMVEVARPPQPLLRRTSSVEILDAAAIDRPDASFDVVASRMGLMFTPDPATAFREIRRVLAPGGRLGALTWGGIAHNPWLTCVGMAAMANGLGSGPPIGPGGIFSLGDPDQLATLVRGAGFLDVETAEIDDHLPGRRHRRAHQAGQLAGRPARRHPPARLGGAEGRRAAHRDRAGGPVPHRRRTGHARPGAPRLGSARAESPTVRRRPGAPNVAEPAAPRRPFLSSPPRPPGSTPLVRLSPKGDACGGVRSWRRGTRRR